MKFTVVIPLYNKASTIDRAIGSVLGQTFQDFELIVVDDGSTDGSVEAIGGSGRDAARIVTQANAGPGKARNAGAALGRGEFIAFLDADDEWKPGFLGGAAGALAGHPECAAYVCAYSSGSLQHVQEEILLRLIARTGVHTIDDFNTAAGLKSYVDCFHSSSSVVRRETFERLGGFFDRERCLYGEDSYFWIQAALTGPAYFDRTQNVLFHVEDSSLGVKLKNRHPRRPALTHPRHLFDVCPADRQDRLELLLAFYRLIETEKLVAHGAVAGIDQLRESFRWPKGGGDLTMRLRDIRVSALQTYNRGFHLVAPKS